MKLKSNVLENRIKSMAKGEVFYINAINLSVKAIDKLRELIQNNEIIPSTTYFNYSDVDGVRSGKVILPQNEYFKN